DVEAPRAVHGERRLGGKRADLCGIEPRRVRAGQILLEGLNVFAGQRRLVVVRDDERGWLGPMNQRVRLREPPVRVGFGPHAVDPDAAEWTVSPQQLRALAVP